jgi:hypothetical protein
MSQLVFTRARRNSGAREHFSSPQQLQKTLGTLGHRDTLLGKSLHEEEGQP